MTPSVALCLFVANGGPRSNAAIANIRDALAAMPDRTFTLEIVDVYEDPDRALLHRVLVTPTLFAPASAQRLIGDLSETTQLRYFLQGLPSGEERTGVS